ncbi:MAG TPA: DUF4956 domain-containing protein [Gemmatimonadales bacterium]|nr:DUF4956 domain-containing protein [Gemmatimonadales bacterium]
MAQHRMSSEAAQTAAREIGRLTILRLTVYYVMAGILIMCLSALLPLGSIGPIPAEPPADMQGAIEWFKGQVAMFPKGAPVWLDALFQMIAAFLLVLPLAFVYVRTRTRLKFDHSLIQTVIVLPIVVTAILVVVRDSLALAFSLAGIVAAVRFRNTLKESGDAVYIFGSIGIGFASGIHAISVAGVLSVVFVVVELALWKFDFSAEFERTFARLCMPSGADMADVPGYRGEPEPTPAGNGAGQAHPDRDGAGRSALLRIYVDQVDAARPKIEAVLERDAKHWTLEQIVAGTGNTPELTYRVRARKSVGLDALREHLLRDAAPHVVAADAPES